MLNMPLNIQMYSKNERRLRMGDNVEMKADDCDELQQAKDLYSKVKRITSKGKDVKVKKKKDGKLYVYEENLQLAD